MTAAKQATTKGFAFEMNFKVWGFPGMLVVKNLLASAGDVRDLSSIPGSGRSPGGGHGNSLQYSCPENPWTEEPGGLHSIGSQRVGHN